MVAPAVVVGSADREPRGGRFRADDDVFRRNIRSRPRFRFQRRAFPSQGRAPPERAILATFTAMPAEPAPRQPSPALQGLYTQTPDVSAFAVDAKAHPADKAGTWVVGPDQMVLACAFNAMRAEVTKFEATLVALGDRDLEAWEAETIKVRRARGRLTVASTTPRRPRDGTTQTRPRGGFQKRTRTVGFGDSRFREPFFRAARKLLFRSAVWPFRDEKPKPKPLSKKKAKNTSSAPPRHRNGGRSTSSTSRRTTPRRRAR